jgi:putative transposase
MKALLVLLAHLLATLAKLMGPGGARAIVAENILMKHQLLVINRPRRRAPNLSPIDRLLLGFWSLFLSPRRILRAATVIRPSTLLRFHETLKKRKYRLLFSPSRRAKPGPKGPSQELILDIEEVKTVPYAPLSHPFVERLIGTIRREYLDHNPLLERGRPGEKAGGAPCLLQ